MMLHPETGERPKKDLRDVLMSRDQMRLFIFTHLTNAGHISLQKNQDVKLCLKKINSYLFWDHLDDLHRGVIFMTIKHISPPNSLYQ